MDIKSKVIDSAGLKRIITRISHEILEKNKGSNNLVINGDENKRRIPGKKSLGKNK